MRLVQSSRTAAIAICVSLCGCGSLNHISSSAIEEELARKPWALARVSYTERGRRLDIRYFDGHTQAVDLPCCARAESASVIRDRIALVDLSDAPDLSDPAFTTEMGNYGGSVLVFDQDGRMVRRSDISLHAELLSLSPDGQSFAFFGTGIRPLSGGWGLYVAGFRGNQARKLLAEVGAASQSASLDWSPDGQALLLADAADINIINVATGESQKVANGGQARWSPLGGWISYVTPEGRAAILNLATHESKLIDPNHDVAGTIEWSPDERYLLIREDPGYFGSFWVYRISDSSWLYLKDLYAAGPRPNWIKVEDSH